MSLPCPRSSSVRRRDCVLYRARALSCADDPCPRVVMVTDYDDKALRDETQETGCMRFGIKYGNDVTPTVRLSRFAIASPIQTDSGCILCKPPSFYFPCVSVLVNT